MAERTISQVISDAEVDARSLSEFVSKDAKFTVTRRLAPSVHTLQYYIDYLDGIKNTSSTVIDKYLGSMSSEYQAAIDNLNSAVSNLDTPDSTLAIAVQDISGKSQQYLNTVAKTWQPIAVESFRQEGFNDSDTIQAALDYINGLPTSGHKLIFERGRLYTYTNTAHIKDTQNLAIDLNGATVRRADASVTTAELALEYTSGVEFTVNQVPSNWKVGDFVMAVVGDDDKGVNGHQVRIRSISGNLIKVSYPFIFNPVKPSLPVGTKISKAFSFLGGLPSSTESQLEYAAGNNARIFLQNGILDGNAANQINVSWRYIGEVGLHSKGGLISNMHFKNTAGETLVGHGFSVNNCVFEDIGGSCIHTSMNDQTKDIAGFAWFTNNTVKRTNLATQARLAHSEGAITFSWGAGNLVVANNIFEDLTESFIGGISNYDEAHGDEFFMVTGNIVKGARAVVHAVGANIRGVHITNNVFYDCGSSWYYSKVISETAGNTIANNTCIGSTSIVQRFRADNIVATGSVETPLVSTPKVVMGQERTNWDGANNISLAITGTQIPDYTPPLSASVKSVIESQGEAHHRFYTTGASGIAHFVKGASKFGSAWLIYNPVDFSYAIGSAEPSGKVVISGGGNKSKIVATSTDVKLPNFTALVLGDDVDNSWRLTVVGSDLVAQRKESGAWVTKGSFTATPPEAAP